MKSASLIDELCSRFRAAIERVAGEANAPRDPQIRPTTDPKFGDYQCNAAMALARPLKQNPRQIAQQIVDAVDLEGVAEPPQIAGPGFINIRLTDTFLERRLQDIPAPPQREDETDRFSIAPTEHPLRVVIDYSSPNIAKQMHVGHLRSTIIGDAFARVLGFLGHEVIRQNHVGDWGTQFGILIAWYRQHDLPDPGSHDDILAAIEEDYRQAQAQFRDDPDFAATSRSAVGDLQAGDPEARHIWSRICELSRGAFLEAYQRLNVLLTDDDVRGESFYNERLADVVQGLSERLTGGTAVSAMKQPGCERVEFRVDQGAACLFFYDRGGEPRFRKPDGDELPMIIQKSDGAYLYATTDLAALRYRTRELGGRRIIYVTDARQRLHFAMLFAAARAAGWTHSEPRPQGRSQGDDVSLEHVTFGSVLGPDRRPLKTREGRNVTLRELLDEAERRALAVVEQKHAQADEGLPLLAPDEQRAVARRIGIAAVKYADLSRDRTSDYVFRWDKLLALQGNTAPYMIYAYARIRSIYRKAVERVGQPDVYAADIRLRLGEPAERALGLRLTRLAETIDQVAADLEPHVLCNYLYDLASDFMRFYEACPVLRAQDEATRLSRLRLCDLTARALRLGLGLLGIKVIERM
jgi:arginyl-tRNA synthetase